MESEGREVNSLGLPASYLGRWINNSATKRTNRTEEISRLTGRREMVNSVSGKSELEGHCVWTEERDCTHQCVSGD